MTYQRYKFGYTSIIVKVADLQHVRHILFYKGIFSVAAVYRMVFKLYLLLACPRIKKGYLRKRFVGRDHFIDRDKKLLILWLL